jgi:hypothetical protein
LEGLFDGFVQQMPVKRFANRIVLLSATNQRLNKDELLVTPENEPTPPAHTENEHDGFLIFLAFDTMIETHNSAMIVSVRPMFNSVMFFDAE